MTQVTITTEVYEKIMRFKEVAYLLKRIVVPYVPYGRHEKWYNVTGEWATDIEFVLLVLQTLIKWGYI